MSRSHNYVFTHNNYDDTTMEDSIECQYIIYGKEVGESGTPHLQGFIRFTQQKSLKQAIKHLPGCHVEVAKCLDEAIQYCKKEGDFTERGRAPVNNKRKGEMEVERYEEAYKLAKTGDLENIPKDILIRHYGALNKIKEANQLKPPSLSVLNNRWLYGPPGSGKTSLAHREYPDAYLKGLTKWWNGYTGQPVVIIDDMDPCHRVLTQELKEWAHHYPFPAETKGGEKCIRPEKIIVTSNYSIDQIWEDSVTRAAMKRRFEEEYIGPPILAPIFNMPSN